MILCIDIGGTAVKLALMDDEGNLSDRCETSVSFDNYETPVLATVLQAAEEMLSAAKAAGIGISTAGLIDTNTGTVLQANIPGYSGTELKREFEEAFGIPVWVLNDANAATLGECFTGRAKGLQHVMMLTLGTGVGGGLVLNGHAYQGAQGIAAELGHFPLYNGGLRCGCGKLGCFEAYASTGALVRRLQAATGEDELNGRIIFARAESGEQVICDELSNWIGDIAAGIVGLVHIFNPEMVLIGGGVSVQEKLLMAPLRKRVLEQVMPGFAYGLRIERATLGNDAGLIGAGRYWMAQQLHKEKSLGNRTVN